MHHIEFLAIREWLGVSVDWLADHLDVSSKTVREWQSGKNLVPPGVVSELRALQDATDQHVDQLRSGLSEGETIQVYDRDVDYWDHARPGPIGWPAQWHRRVAVRLSREVNGLTITGPE